MGLGFETALKLLMQFRLTDFSNCETALNFNMQTARPTSQTPIVWKPYLHEMILREGGIDSVKCEQFQ